MYSPRVTTKRIVFTHHLLRLTHGSMGLTSSPKLLHASDSSAVNLHCRSSWAQGNLAVDPSVTMNCTSMTMYS